MIQLDGCIAVTTSSWKQLEEIRVCWYSDGTSAAAVLSLMAVNYAF